MANHLLYPKNTETRRFFSLDGLWKFKLDKANKGDSEDWKSGLPDAEWMPVPSSFNDLFTDKGIREFTGSLWYERDVIVPAEWKEKDLDLRFGAVAHQAEVFVNGVKVGEHIGGYTPFNVSIKEAVSFEKQNRLVVKVSNELSETTLPVGNAAVNLMGHKVTSTTTDYFNYSGIQRSVQLVATPKESILDYSLQFEVDHTDRSARVSFEVETNGENPVYLEIFDENNRLAATAEGKNGSVTIDRVRLWQPRDAYLYTFKWSVQSAEEVLDVYTDEVGIRTVGTRGQELLINGRPVYLKGYVKHEQSDLHGAGSNLAVTKRDFELMKWNGANAFRTAQFPHDEEVYRMADREGIIILNQVPAIGMAAPKPNRFNPDRGKGVEPFFERESVQTETLRQHIKMVQELIQRDKHRASVCVWSLMEEPETVSAEFETYANELIEAAKKEDAQKRPFTILFSAASLKDNPHLADMVDVVAVNEYFGWEELGGFELSDAEEELAQTIAAWKEWEKPVLVTGYGSEALQGEMKLPSVQWSENYQNEVFEMQHRLFDMTPFIQGEFVWSFSDYQTPEGLTAVDGNNSGVFTSNRQPKTAAYVLKKRWETLSEKDAAASPVSKAQAHS